MFGTDEHSQAMLGQWNRAKQLRDPAVVINLAKEKGLNLFKLHTMDASEYAIDRGGDFIFRGSLEDAAKFVDDYTALSSQQSA